MKPVLGTAQFGLNYGVTNTRGQVSEKEVVHILEYAAESGINLIDTAVAYGNSESLLGKYCSRISDFQFISKIQLDPDLTSDDIERQVIASCKRLGVEKLYGLLVHNAEVLNDSKLKGAWPSLLKLKEKGLVDKIGVSVYSLKQALNILDSCAIDLIQVPYNVLDQRFNNAVFLAKLRANNIELHARSLFLQGLLLTQPADLPAYFSPVKQQFVQMQAHCSKMGISLLQMIMIYIKQSAFLDAFVFGVTSKKELAEIITAWTMCLTEYNNIDWSGFGVSEERYLNPSLWELA